MAKQRVSTTVDEDLLARARDLNPSGTDASMMEQALVALIERHRRAEIDDSYREAWAEHPADEPDEWGDLASFSEAVSSG
jgi:post-segregation antitoxin (ccd killing protein)